MYFTSIIVTIFIFAMKVILRTNFTNFTLNSNVILFIKYMSRHSIGWPSTVVFTLPYLSLKKNELK